MSYLDSAEAHYIITLLIAKYLFITYLPIAYCEAGFCKYLWWQRAHCDLVCLSIVINSQVSPGYNKGMAEHLLKYLAAQALCNSLAVTNSTQYSVKSHK